MRKIITILIILTFMTIQTKRMEASPQWEGIVIHITDSTHMSLDECNAWHKEKGWDGCGYSFVIEPSGHTYEARGLKKAGAHTLGYNAKFLGIAFVATERITDEQIQSYRSLRKSLRDKLQRDLPTFRHSHFKNKTCPTKSVWEKVKML